MHFQILEGHALSWPYNYVEQTRRSTSLQNRNEIIAVLIKKSLALAAGKKQEALRFS